MKKKAKQIANVMSNDSLEVVAQMIVDEAKGVRYEVYADGSSKNNKCGCGWLVLHKGAIINSGKYTFITAKVNDSVRAEIRAVIQALGDCPPLCSVDVYVDCQVAIERIQAYKLGDLQPIYNKVAKGKVIRYHWVKAHRGNMYNEMVDSLAFSATES